MITYKKRVSNDFYGFKKFDLNLKKKIEFKIWLPQYRQRYSIGFIRISMAHSTNTIRIGTVVCILSQLTDGTSDVRVRKKELIYTGHVERISARRRVSCLRGFSLIIRPNAVRINRTQT